MASLAAVVVGLALIAFYALPDFTGDGSGDAERGTENTSPTGQTTAVDPTAGPEDKTLKLTVPKMQRVDNRTIPTAEPDEEALRDNVAVRLPGTGLPWENEANVYIAGHELGYPFTDSFRAFYDLKELQKGDKVYLTDADGREYTYEIFDIIIVQPDDLWVLDPLKDRNIVSLQVSETQQQDGDNIPKRVARAELVETTG